MSTSPATDSILASLVAIASIISGIVAAVEWIEKKRQLRRVDQILGSTPADGPTDIPIPPVGRAPAIDLSLDAASSQEIVFGVMPFIDHTQAFIGQRLGWFAEAGISPTFLGYTPDTAIDALEKGEIDVLSATPSALVKRGSNPHCVQAFVLHDLFQGYGLMYRPSLFSLKKLEPYGVLRKKGNSHGEALRRIASYLSGRRVAHANDDAIAPFLDRVMSADPEAMRFLETVTASELDAVRSVVRRKADFQVGGAPSRLTLERLGFRVLISSRDLLENGLLFKDSREYLALIQCGWFASKDWIDRSPDLVLRMASVSYRISNFICDHPDLAAAIHLRFLNQIAGTSLRLEDIRKAYVDLHPFKSFEDQRAWFYDSSNALNVKTVTENIIKYWREVLSNASFENINDAEDIVSAKMWHRRLLELRRKCIDAIHNLQHADPEFLSSAQYRAASQLFYSYNYIDCLALLLKGTESASRVTL